MTEGTKYHPLFEHLLFNGRGQITMTFKEIEVVLGKPLPPSARLREEWWSNSPRGHSQAQAWMRARYRTSGIDLAGETVEFKLEGWPEGYVKPSWPRLLGDEAPAGLGELPQAEFEAPVCRHPLFGILKGVITIPPDVDLTDPAFPDWDEYLDQKYGPKVHSHDD